MQLVALRNQRTQEILNVSYTKDGLKYTYNQAGRNLFDAPFTKVVPYEFLRHKNPHLMKKERLWARKARIL